jgi:hypothetical protein
MTRGRRPLAIVTPMVDTADPDRDAPDDETRDGALVRTTRAAVGAALIGAAVVSAVLDGRDRHVELDSPSPGPSIASLLTAAALGAAIEVERRSAAAVHVARSAARTAVNVAHLTPLHFLIEGVRGRVEAWSDRGRAEGEAGIERVADAWDVLLGGVVAQVLRHVDVDDLMTTVDLDAVASRIDVDAVAARIDVDALIAGIDVDAIVARVDVEEIVRRLDLAGIAREVLDELEVEDIIRESSGSLAVQTVDALRTRGADADRRLAGFVDRLLQRRRGRDVGVGYLAGDGSGVNASRPDEAS